MIVWLVAVPAVLLLLAFAGANWKVFHLAYARHLLRSEDPGEQGRGLTMIERSHLKQGMTEEEVARLVHPVKMKEERHSPDERKAGVSVESAIHARSTGILLQFRDGRLLRFGWYYDVGETGDAQWTGGAPPP